MKKINKTELHQIFIGMKTDNQNSYNLLYEKYYKLVYGIVFSIIKNNEDTEDIVHEVFTKIYKLDKDKLPESNEASWLFTVSKNESYMFLRKSKPDISIEEIYEISGENNNIVSSNKRKMSNTFIVQQTENDIDKIIDADYFNGVISGLKEDEKQINKEEQNIMRQNVRTGDTIAYIVGAVAIIIGINLAILKLKTRKE